MNRKNLTQRCFTIAVVAIAVIVGGLDAASPVVAGPNVRSDRDRLDRDRLAYASGRGYPRIPACTLEPYADCSGVDLRGRGLSRKNLTGVILKGATLDNADLTGAILRGADLTDASLSGVVWSNTTCPNGMVSTGTPCGIAITASESGFSYIEPIDYYFQDASNQPVSHTTTPAMIWYSYHPAEQPGSASQPSPLFVMLNGGPGAATSANLFANNTAPYTFIADESPVGKPGYRINPYRWSKLGHLLYIDAPLTGFSYNIGPAGFNDSVQVRIEEAMFKGNLNPFIDAAQILRVVLRFLDTHEELQDSPVIFVGESYGGTRVSTMLNLLLFSGRYDAGVPYDARLKNIYHDPRLVAEIAGYFTAQGEAFDPLSDAAAAAQTVAAKFGRQVLIQPQLSARQTNVQGDMYWSENTIMKKVLASRGSRWYPTANLLACNLNGIFDKSACVTQLLSKAYDFDGYNWNKKFHWTDDLEASATVQLTQLGTLNTILGYDVNTLRDIKPYRRSHLANATVYKDFGVYEAIQQYVPAALAWYPAGIEYQRIKASQDYIAGRIGSQKPEGTLEQAFGTLDARDSYFSPWSYEIYAFYWLNLENIAFPDLYQGTALTYGNFFLENARYVETFLTDAEYDLAIYSPALPVALEQYHKGVGVESIAVTRGGTLAGDNNRGTFKIRYVGGAEVNVFYPRYLGSGHAVAASQPEDLRADIAAWLECSATKTCF